METEVIHTTRKGKSILSYFPLILNYSVGSMYNFPIQTLIITPLRNVMLTVTRELGLPVTNLSKTASLSSGLAEPADGARIHTEWSASSQSSTATSGRRAKINFGKILLLMI